MEKIRVNNLECIRLNLVAGQGVYYLPQQVAGKRISRIYSYLPTAARADVSGTPVATASVLTDATLTVGATDGTYLLKDVPLAALSLSQYRNDTGIYSQIDYLNSYVKLPTEPTAAAVLLLYFAYEDEEGEKYRQITKCIPVTIPSSNLQPARLLDYISGYQGKLNRIEVVADDATSAYLTLNDAAGRCMNYVTTDFWRNASGWRIYNPVRLAPMNVDWQNSFCYCNGTVKLYLYFVD